MMSQVNKNKHILMNLSRKNNTLQIKEVRKKIILKTLLKAIKHFKKH